MSNNIYFFLLEYKTIARINPGSTMVGIILNKYCTGSACITYPRHGERYTPPYDIIFKQIERIKNSYIVLIKQFITTSGKMRYDPKIIKELRRNNNKIIYIVVDAMAKNLTKFKEEITTYADLYDLVLFGSKYQYNMFKDIVPSNVLYHLWDDELQPNTSEEFNMCYLGSSFPWKNYMLKCLDIDILHVSKCEHMDYEKIKNYNCHYSIRLEESSNFKYGTTTKLATAAATHSNIICSKDESFIDILPEYDYYINNIDEIPDMVDRVKKEFATSPWYKNLARMKRIKELLSPATIANNFKEHLSTLS